MQSVLLMSHTPETPIACGDPISGQVRWTNRRHSAGYWLGDDYVLTAHPWAILSGDTGREIPSNVGQVLKENEPYEVHAVGNYVIVQNIHSDPMTTVCFRFIPPATR